jgi:hypothetical protein
LEQQFDGTWDGSARPLRQDHDDRAHRDGGSSAGPGGGSNYGMLEGWSQRLLLLFQKWLHLEATRIVGKHQ